MKSIRKFKKKISHDFKSVNLYASNKKYCFELDRFEISMQGHHRNLRYDLHLTSKVTCFISLIIYLQFYSMIN